EIFESVIKSDYRMTYTAVNKILGDDKVATKKELHEITPMIIEEGQLAKIIRSKRELRGAIDCDFNETKVLVDKEGSPEDIVLRTRGAGEKLIEEFMLLSNETVAETFHWMELPFIYRVHEDPKEDRLRQFFDFLTGFGI